jgi:hypothetical protein
MRSTRAFTAVVLAVAALGAVGCTQHQTEMILVITTEGVRIPDDVQKLHLTVADREPSLDDTVYEQDVNLCNPMLTTACYDIPVTGVLFPGKTRGSDTVRVEVDAIGPGGTVIADAALFTFAEHQSLRLDFVLYANCLGNVACAERDQACGPLDTCVTLMPGQTNGPLDIALAQEPKDMTVPQDLIGADLTTVPADLTSTLDLAGCAGVVCDMGEQCVAGQCIACGDQPGDPCCFSAGGGPATGGTCSQSNLTCNGSVCVQCGALVGELCCTSATPACLMPNMCVGNICEAPPPDMAMSSKDMSVGIKDQGASLDMF